MIGESFNWFLHQLSRNTHSFCIDHHLSTTYNRQLKPIFFTMWMKSYLNILDEITDELRKKEEMS